jgi:hypothetical protein
MSDDRIENLEDNLSYFKEAAHEWKDRALKAEERTHYAEGAADLAMKHRDDAEARAIKAEAALRNVRLMLFENPSHVAAIRGALTIIETALDKQEGE